MRPLRFVAFAAALPVIGALSSAQTAIDNFSDLGFNRLQLDNGGEVLQFINDPYVGSDPLNNDFSGDWFFKVFPGAATQRCVSQFSPGTAATSTLNGWEQAIFDQDWTDGSALYDILIQPGVLQTDGAVFPANDVNAPGIFLGGGAINPTPPACPPPGFITGFQFTFSVMDTTTGAFTPWMSNDPTDPNALITDGPGTLGPDGLADTGDETGHDWVWQQFFPGGASISVPATNGCGGAGNGPLNWNVSDDGAGPGTQTWGENQGDWTGGAFNGYHGLGVGGGGGAGWTGLAETAELAWMFGEMTMNLRVNADLNDNYVEDVRDGLYYPADPGPDLILGTADDIVNNGLGPFTLAYQNLGPDGLPGTGDEQPNGFFNAEIGLAGLHLPIGINGGTCPAGTNYIKTSTGLPNAVTNGSRVYDSRATSHIIVSGQNLGGTPLLNAFGFCIGLPAAGPPYTDFAFLGLTPTPFWGSSLGSSGFAAADTVPKHYNELQNPVLPLGNGVQELGWNSAQNGLLSTCVLIGIPIYHQSYRLNLLTGAFDTSSNILTQNFTDNTGL